ncbi:hypothetical protein [Gayadomonas joobiniege]|uniref:hypothetical protein n=1 Tax=Gayadomonas joobiniege TaxID=1234606 RepID=UPI00036AF75F|nr:hypothetical protein [Gayadomonas joobiniege]
MTHLNVKAYQKSQFDGLNDHQRLLYLINQSILACQQQATGQLNKSLLLLNLSIDETQWPELASALNKFYQHAFYLAEQQDFTELQPLLVKFFNLWQRTNHQV